MSRDKKITVKVDGKKVEMTPEEAMEAQRISGGLTEFVYKAKDGREHFGRVKLEDRGPVNPTPEDGVKHYGGLRSGRER